MKRALTTLALAVGCALPMAASAALTLSINPATQNVAQGGTVSFDVTISGLQSAGVDEIVSVFDLNVLFDSALLGTPASVIWNSFPQMGGAGLAEWFVDFNPGNLGVDAFSYLTDDDDLMALQSDSFVLFTADLTAAMMDGVTTLSFGPDPDFDRLVVGRNATPLDLTYVGACVSVGAASCNRVPEPTSYALVLAALAISGAATRRRRRQG